MKINWLWLLVWLQPLPAAAELVGRVVSVNDGDTLTVVINDREQMRIHLLGIDAPGPYQDFGKQSQSNLAVYAFGKDVRLDDIRKDRGGQTLARVWVTDAACAQPNCPKTLDVGLAQVAAGLAWHDPQHGKEMPVAERQRYAEAEFMAKVRRLGLWSGKSPKAPWASKPRRLEE